jgi:hypothetical protein
MLSDAQYDLPAGHHQTRTSQHSPRFTWRCDRHVNSDVVAVNMKKIMCLDVKPLIITLIMKVCRNKQSKPIHQVTETRSTEASCLFRTRYGFRLVEAVNALVSDIVTGVMGRGREQSRWLCSVNANAHWGGGQSTRGKGWLRGGKGGHTSPHTIGNQIIATDKMTLWKVVSVGVKHTGTFTPLNILKDKSESAPYAKRSIDNSDARSWRLFVDECMFRHIKKRTESEARRVVQDGNWTLSLE